MLGELRPPGGVPHAKRTPPGFAERRERGAGFKRLGWKGIDILGQIIIRGLSRLSSRSPAGTTEEAARTAPSRLTVSAGATHRVLLWVAPKNRMPCGIGLLISCFC